jgi:membrane protein
VRLSVQVSLFGLVPKVVDRRLLLTAHLFSDTGMQTQIFAKLRDTEVIKTIVRNFRDDDIVTYTAALTYYLFFSIFPFTLFLIALLGFFELSDFFTWLRKQSEILFTPEMTQQVDDLLVQLQQRKQALLSFGTILTLWAASSGMRAAMRAMNAVHDVKESRPFWKRYFLSILYTVAIGVVLTVATALVLVGPKTMDWLAGTLGVLPDYAVFQTFWWIRWPVVAILLVLAISTIYHIGPDVKHKFRLLTPGALLAVAVWIASSVAFDHYVDKVVNYNAMFGSVGAVIVFLLYLFISSLVLLLGAEIDAAVRHHSKGDTPSG